MRPSHPLFESPYFQFKDFATLLRSLGEEVGASEREEILRLNQLGLPPISSRLLLAALIGVNPGLIWSFCKRPNKHYRIFRIPKGKQFRTITAPRVALKIIQKWLSVQLQKHYVAPDHVFGFVPGRSHLLAAQRHSSAEWIVSVDVHSFFSTTPQKNVEEAFLQLGYNAQSAQLFGQLTCFLGNLAQGAPTSPIISNMCFAHLDARMHALAIEHGARLTRYADDIVFSGIGIIPENLLPAIQQVFSGSPWALAEEKTEVAQLPNRLKVHGLLVHGENIRLTKGYRNRLRAYAHLKKSNAVLTDASKIEGHLQYGRSVSKISLKDNY